MDIKINHLMPGKRVFLIYNPQAGSASDADLWLGTVIHRFGLELEATVIVMPTSENKDFLDQNSDLETADLIVAAGGDGTLCDILGRVAKAGLKTPIGILPLGTGNQLARNLGIFEENLLSDPLERAIEIMLKGEITAIDLGVMNGHYFGVGAGVGPISDAVILPNHQDKANWKLFAYATSALGALTLPPVAFKITADGESFVVQSSGIFITNVADYGLGSLSGTAELQDGLLDLCILTPVDFQDYLKLGFHFAGALPDGEAPYYIKKVRKVTIETLNVEPKLSAFQELSKSVRGLIAEATISTSGQMPAADARAGQSIAMIDGDPCGTTPMVVEVVPNAVNILTPRKI